MTAILLVAGFTLLSSFLCSLFEAALYAVTITQAEVLASRNRFGAARLHALRSDPQQPIAAILTVNTVAHTGGAAWFGSLVAERYGEGSPALAIATALLTVAILLLTEIVPKSLGVTYAQRVGPAIAWPLQVMIWMVWPLAWLSAVLMRRFGAEHTPPSEDEVVVLARQAAQAGRLRRQEHRWVRNALLLDRVATRDIMTPRTVVRSMPASRRLSELDASDSTWQHSRIPVTGEAGLDDVIGLVYRKEVFDALMRGDVEHTLGDLCRPLEIVPETMPAHALLDKLVRDKVHLVAVADEYGGIEGVVTLEDVLECLLGSEIVDEHDEVADMQALARAQGLRRLGALESSSREPSSREPPPTTARPVEPGEPRQEDAAG